MSQREPMIQVTSTEWVVVMATGMFDDESYNVRYVIDVGCDLADAGDIAYSPDGAPLVLSPRTQPLTLKTPGWYRIVPNGVVNDHAKVFWNAVPANRVC